MSESTHTQAPARDADVFPSDPAGLPGARPTEVVELGPGAEGQVSPDGGWLAYVEHRQVVVERFPARDCAAGGAEKSARPNTEASRLQSRRARWQAKN